MIQFHDGPAKGTTLWLSRAPLLLRVVVDQFDGKVDALDQPDDEPQLTELVHVYRRVRYDGAMFVCGRGSGSGKYHHATYAHLPDVDGEQLRDRDAWVTWAKAHLEREAPAPDAPSRSSG